MTLATQASDVPPPDAAHHRRQKPHLTIKSRRGWIGINLGELWHFRDLLISLTIRDVKLRYKQAALGIAWVILQPLVAAAIFSYVFNGLAKLPRDTNIYGREIPSFLYAFNGMVAWTLFSSIVSKVPGVLVGNSSMVSKVYFPRLLLPLSGATGTLVDLVVAFTLMLGIQAFYGVPVGWTFLAVPVVLALIMCLALGIGMWAAALCVQYRDVAYIVPVMVQFLLFASPIGYSVSIMGTAGKLNPLAGLLGVWRWSLLETPFPETWMVVHAVCVSLGFLIIGAFVFRRMERTFADVI
jgi:lipopolysaccharide transport system permease protein